MRYGFRALISKFWSLYFLTSWLNFSCIFSIRYVRSCLQLFRGASNDGATAPLPGIRCKQKLSVGQADDDCKKIQTFQQRWIALGLYSLVCFTLGAINNVFGAIAHASELAFGWHDFDIALIGNWVSFMYIFFIVVFIWFLEREGLRMACVVSSLLMCGGAAIRCLTTTGPWCNWFMHGGHILIGLCGPLVYSGPSVLSVVWFPPHERTTATAISTTSNIIGVALGLFIGPFIVKVHQLDNSLATSKDLSYDTFIHERSLAAIVDIPTSSSDDILYDVTRMREEIQFLLFINFFFALMTFLLVLFCFPDKPPLPPSLSAFVERINLKEGFWILFRNHRLWVLALAYATTNGIYTTFLGIVDVDLKAANIANDQVVTSYLVLLAVGCGCVSSVFVARVADSYARHSKTIIISLCILATAFFTWFALILHGTFARDLVPLFVSFTLGSTAISSTVPIFYELACEIAYPVTECLSNSVLNFMNCALSVVFVLAFMIPNIGTVWMNWCLVGSIAVCIPLLLPFKQTYGRLEMESKQRSPVVDYQLDYNSECGDCRT